MDFLKPYISKGCSVYRCPSDPEQKPYPYDPEITLSYGINLWRFRDIRTMPTTSGIRSDATTFIAQVDSFCSAIARRERCKAPTM